MTTRTGEMTTGAVAPPVWSWTPIIKQALASGRTDVVDPGTGFHRPIYAACPSDGHAAGIWRIVRGPADAIIAITMRCPTCGTEFAADPDSLFLH